VVAAVAVLVLVPALGPKFGYKQGPSLERRQFLLIRWKVFFGCCPSPRRLMVNENNTTKLCPDPLSFVAKTIFFTKGKGLH